jgi:hypothetical protein
VAVAAGLGLAVLALVGVRRSAARATAAAPQEAAPPAPDYDPFEQGSPSEQRKSSRRKGRAVEILLSDAQVLAPPWRGYVIDRSLGGMRLCCPCRVDPGTRMTVRPVDAPEGVPWTEVDVRSCREAKEGWELGVQYVRTPPMGVLLMFH